MGGVKSVERETPGVASNFEPVRLGVPPQPCKDCALPAELGILLKVMLERETGFEPATSTLARLRSTN
jgi:hypothetical protein